MKYLSNSENETKKILNKIFEKYPDYRVFCLYGDLGAGKTTLTKGISSLIHVNEKKIKSPTFTILNKYIHNGKKVYHFDLYRVTSYEELRDIGFEEMLDEENSYIFIEWPSKIQDNLPQKRIDIELSHEGQSERRIKVQVNK